MKLLYLFFFSLIPFSHLRAEASLTLDEVSRAVLANNPAIKAALSRWNATRERIPQELAWEDPKLSAMSRAARFVTISPNAFTDQIVSIEQMVPLSGKNRSRARIAAAEAVVAYEEARRQQLDALAQARKAYIRLLNANAQRELNRKNQVSLKAIAEITRSKYEVGSQSVANVLMAESEADRLMETHSDLAKAIAAEQSTLAVLMNRDAFEPLGEPVEFEAINLNFSANQLRVLLFANRPEVKIAQARVAAEKAKLQLAQREWIPDPALTIQTQRYNSASQVVSEVDAGVSVNLPWINYRKYAAAIREATYNLNAAEKASEKAQTEALALLRNALLDIETAHHHVELFRDKLIPQAQQAFEAGQFSYESGKANFQDWIAAQRNLRDIESAGRDHITTYRTALVELEDVIGANLEVFPSQQLNDSEK